MNRTGSKKEAGELRLLPDPPYDAVDTMRHATLRQCYGGRWASRFGSRIAWITEAWAELMRLLRSLGTAPRV